MVAVVSVAATAAGTAGTAAAEPPPTTAVATARHTRLSALIVEANVETAEAGAGRRVLAPVAAARAIINGGGARSSAVRAAGS